MHAYVWIAAAIGGAIPLVGDTELIEEAALAYEDVLDGDPNSSRAHLKLGVAYVEIGQREAAEAEWLTAASLAPRAAGPRVNLGLLYEREGREEDARAVLREALALDPTNAQAQAALERLSS